MKTGFPNTDQKLDEVYRLVQATAVDYSQVDIILDAIDELIHHTVMDTTGAVLPEGKAKEKALRDLERIRPTPRLP